MNLRASRNSTGRNGRLAPRREMKIGPCSGTTSSCSQTELTQTCLRERFALNQYLMQLDNAQVAFGVRQAKLKVVDEVVRLTLEMESYLQPTRPSRTSPTLTSDYDSDVIGAASSQLRNDPLQQILEHMDCLETELQFVRQPQKVGPSSDRGSTSSRKPWSRERVPTCWNCRGDGHLARDCPSPKKSPQQQGNDKPSMQ